MDLESSGGGQSTVGADIDLPSYSSLRSRAGVTLVETLVALMVIVIGLAGLFSTSAQFYTTLRKAKEMVAAREDILSRLDTIRTLSYKNFSSATKLAAAVSGDASPFSMITTAGMKNFTETITVYALGEQLFSNDSDLNNATPDSSGEYASQIDSIAPAAPKTYISTSTAKGAWSLQSAGNSLPSIKVIRVGTGSGATTTPGTSGDLTSYPQLRVDVTDTWSGSNNVSRTQVASTIVSKSGSLP